MLLSLFLGQGRSIYFVLHLVLFCIHHFYIPLVLLGTVALIIIKFERTGQNSFIINKHYLSIIAYKFSIVTNENPRAYFLCATLRRKCWAVTEVKHSCKTSVRRSNRQEHSLWWCWRLISPTKSDLHHQNYDHFFKRPFLKITCMGIFDWGLK